MHILQPKHIKLKPEEAEELLNQFNISLTQLPKIKINDPGLPENCKIGDIVKLERIDNETREKMIYFRVVSV